MGSAAPIYETPADRVNEERAIALAAGVLRCDSWRKLPQFCPFDFTLKRGGQPIFWAEVKTRHCASTAHPDFMLSAAKVQALLDWQDATGIPARLVVGWTDCMGILRLACRPSHYDVGGRRDRGGLHDIERVAHWPVEAFRLCKWS